MRGPTHALGGAATAAVFLLPGMPHTIPLIALSAIAGFAALLPDLDNTQSTAENITVFGMKPFAVPAFIIEKLFKHRGFWHSLMAVILIAFVLLGFLPQLPKDITFAVLLGYLSHMVLDSLTPEGVPWFWPFGGHQTLLPKFLCITTGSFMETVFFIVLIVVYVIFLSKAGYVILPT